MIAYVRTAEGRILRYGSNHEHEYALADHQGNIRSTFGMLHDTDVYYATMETERATEEQADFLNMTTNFVGLYNHTEATIELPNPDRSKYIAPGSSGDIGTAIAIPVNSGDKISATNLMKKAIQLVGLTVALILQGCSGQELTKNDIVGTWVAEDGGKLDFNKDGSFRTESLSGSKFFSGFNKYQNMKFSEEGKWELIEKNGRQIIDLKIAKSEKLQGGFSTHLGISGEGAFGNNPPWHLFVWIGDPDDMNKYKFEKQ